MGLLRSPFDIELGNGRQASHKMLKIQCIAPKVPPLQLRFHFIRVQKDHNPKKQPGPRAQYFRSMAWIKALLTLTVLYLAGLTLVIALFRRLPKLDELKAQTEAAGNLEASSALKLQVPHTFDELRAVRSTLEAYREAYASQVATLLVVTYLFLQTFFIPGPMGINVLAGSLYPFSTALLFAGVVSTIGASLNYWLVRLLLKDAVTALFPGRIAAFQTELSRHKAHLLNFMLFVRVTPVLPHWFVNLASPIVGVPFHIFLTATAVGHQPMNFITVQAGAALSSIQGLSDLYSPRNVLFLMAVGAVALIPVLWNRRRSKGKGTAAQGAVRKHTRLTLLPVIDKSSMP